MQVNETKIELSQYNINENKTANTEWLKQIENKILPGIKRIKIQFKMI